MIEKFGKMVYSSDLTEVWENVAMKKCHCRNDLKEIKKGQKRMVVYTSKAKNGYVVCKECYKKSIDTEYLKSFSILNSETYVKESTNSDNFTMAIIADKNEEYYRGLGFETRIGKEIRGTENRIFVLKNQKNANKAKNIVIASLKNNDKIYINGHLVKVYKDFQDAVNMKIRSDRQ